MRRMPRVILIIPPAMVPAVDVSTQDIVIGLVSCMNGIKAELKPDILHMYVLKSVRHITLLFLSIVNLSCAVVGESMFPVAEARPCNWMSFHCIGGVCPVTTDTIFSNVVLEFFSSCMKYTERSCVGLVMEHTMFKSFSRRVTVDGMACI